MSSTGNLKDCANGHVYDSLENSSCPWCPSGSSETTNDADKKTVILGAEEPTVPSSDTIATPKSNQPVVQDFGKTIIRTSDDDAKKDSVNKIQRRKLRGWLVTYDHADYGDDYKITEGSNTIGSKAGNTITISDPLMTSEHAIILCK